MYINPVTLSNQSTPAPGLLPLTAEQEAIYLQYNGFVRITSTDPVTLEPDTESWEAWKSSLPPETAPQPTLEERTAALESAMLSMMGVNLNV